MQVHLALDKRGSLLQSGPTVSRARPSIQGPQGPTPYPAYLLQLIWASYGCHMWSCRKADAVFPFVKSSFWKAVSILMIRLKQVQRGEGSRKAAGTVVWCFVHILQGLIITARMWGYADLAKWGHAIVFNASTPAFIHESSKTHTHRRRHKHSHDVYLSVAEQFLCQSSADTDRQYGVEDACHKREKPEWNDRLSRHPSPPLPPSLTLPKHLTHSSLDCYDKPDTCQSCTHRQDGEDSSIHRSTC